MNIPKNYLPVMPYLILKEAKAFMDFAKRVFEAKEQLIVPGENETIMHGELKIHDAIIMFAQAGEIWTEKTAGMYIYVTDVNKVYQKALENGSTTLMAPEKKEYGYSGGFEDPFGNHWWIVEG
ncbi:transposase [Sporocytophaga myxococcoides]|uniref:Transposase n=1 Tax=Sporocytophaga myxococcoides TaxID=153721 RepID=A0A098LA79_9BACT|nr:VOC family protein [Sporocytophaga myxococcoides]GAL83317.1 transposase [Sporocytophaga myxococcoides]